MSGHKPIIKTKLMVPTVKDESIRRAKLTRKMKAIAKHPLTIVHSSAGYGKSTALALFISDERRPCCWYSISSADDDILPFLTYLIASVKTIFPQFGRELSQYINEMNRYIREEELSLLCSLFINEIVMLNDEITMILDDFHQIEHSYTVSRWLEKLLEHIPDNLHLVISSRSRPLWKPLTKMKASGQILEITREDLVLTIDEAELLLTEFYQISISPAQLGEIFQITEGWVIAIGMIAQQIPVNGEISGLFSRRASRNDLFQYLVMEVFSIQPPIIQQFLEQTCIFEEITVEICDAVLGITGSGAMLEQLAAKNLFIQKIGGRQFRYHALFKEFLEKQLLDNQPRNYQILHERSARFFEEKEMWEAALFHYEKINLGEAIAAILHGQGQRMLQEGKLESLFERLSKLPDLQKDRFPTLWQLQGEVFRYRSLYTEAEYCYDRAIDGAEKSGDVLEQSRALEGKARIYLDTIQPYNAERLLYRAIKMREKSPAASEKETGELYHLLAENLINSGQASKAERWLARAKDLKMPVLDGNLEARIYLRTGRLKEARQILLSSKKQMKAEDPSLLPQSHRETDLLLALIEAFSGNGKESKTLAQEGIQHGISKQSPFVEACGWIRMGHAVQILHGYDLELAEKCYETALEMMGRLGIERGKAEPLMGLCLLYGSRGEYERAAAAGESALHETEKVQDHWLSALITLCMGIAAIYKTRFTDGLHAINRAEAQLAQCGDQYGKMVCGFWKAYIFYQSNENKAFIETIDSFLKLLQFGEFEFFLHNKTIFGPRDLQMAAPLLIEADKQDIQSHFLTKLLHDLKLGRLQSHPGYTLRVQTLGQFRIWLGNKEVEERQWQRGKAKELFQFFVSKRPQLITKDEIFQFIWNGQDEKYAGRDFKVALNALNNVLEPGRKARSTPFFIMRDTTAYGLNPEALLEIDSVLFEEWIQTGLEERNDEKAIPILEKAMRLYRGEYLIERRYDDWCINEREKFLVYFLRGAEKLAQLCVRKEDYDSAILWCEKILEKERTWEEAYRLLMYCYYRKNNRPQAMKWFQKCCHVLENELGVSPLEPTLHMYQMIMESETITHTIKQP